MSCSQMLILLVILVSSLIKICHLHNISLLFLNHASSIRDLRRIRNTIDQTTACTIATSLIHSKIDYSNSLLLNLPATQTNRLQLVHNSAARAVTKTPKCHHKINGSRQMSESNTRFSLWHINLSQLVNLLTSALFFHSLHIVVLGFPLLSPLVALAFFTHSVSCNLLYALLSLSK